MDETETFKTYMKFFLSCFFFLQVSSSFTFEGRLRIAGYDMIVMIVVWKCQQTQKEQKV
jgi:hypothetical protein